jgi:NAD(P)-dependent dehydrogenase (short-subunit alcohol dehydrogenase family)
VAVSGRRADALAAVVEVSREAGPAMDARVPADWVASHDALCRTWDAVDMVVFCAAEEYRPLRPWEIDAEEARRTVETNLCSVYYGLAAVRCRP